MHSEPGPSCCSAKPVPVRIVQLRHSLALLERTSGMIDEGFAPIELGVAEIDNSLGGGLARGALHEIAAVRESTIAAATGFTLGLVTRACAKSAAMNNFDSLSMMKGNPSRCKQRESALARKSVLWIAETFSLAENGAFYAPGLDQAGVAPQNLLMVTARRTRDVLWAMEETLRCRAVGVVIGEIRSSIDPVTIRRLSHAAATGGALGLVLRPRPDAAPCAFATRWIVQPVPSAALASQRENRTDHELGPPRLLVRLNRNRRGQPGEWIVEWNSVEQRFELTAHSESMVRPVFNRSHRAAAG
jgi:protein ImuA